MKQSEMFRSDDQTRDRMSPMHNDRMLNDIDSVCVLLMTTNVVETVSTKKWVEKN